MIWIYTLFLCLVTSLMAFKVLIARIRHGKYRKALLDKIGFRLPYFSPKSKKRIWIHAVSLGEVKSSFRLIGEIVKEGDCEVILSTSTPVGYQAGLTNSQVTRVFYLPLDIYPRMKKLVERMDPDVFLLIESDFWFSLLTILRKKKIPSVLINGRMSDRSYHRYKKFPRFARALFSSFSSMYCLTKTDQERFLSFGGNSVSIAPNLKVEIPFIIAPEGKDIMLTCSHEQEEKMLLPILEKSGRPIIIAPRKPERFDDVARFLQSRGKEFCRSSTKEKGAKITLIDQIGVLGKYYPLSHVVIVGGSFVPHVGGHSPIEPLSYGKHVIVGPYRKNQLSLVNPLLSEGLVISANLQNLETILGRLLEKKTNPRIEEFFTNSLGVSARIWDEIRKTFALNQIPSYNNAQNISRGGAVGSSLGS